MADKHCSLATKSNYQEKNNTFTAYSFCRLQFIFIKNIKYIFLIYIIKTIFMLYIFYLTLTCKFGLHD